MLLYQCYQKQAIGLKKAAFRRVYMCFNPQILSVFFDKELSSLRKEKIEQHLSVCPKCREKLESYGTISHNLKSAGNSAVHNSIINEAKERVWEKLKHSFAISLSATLTVRQFAVFIGKEFIRKTLLFSKNSVRHQIPFTFTVY
jgi:uncharacterized CHY-type Zn-finger protein